MKELWEQSILSYNLPLTVLLGLLIIFWALALIGTFDIDSLDFDIDTDIDGDLDTDVSAGSGGFLTAILKFVNATDVPIMMVVSFLSLFMWVISIISNYALNPSQSWIIATGLFIGNFFLSCLLVKLVTSPFKKFFNAFKKGENDDEPVIGRIGTVKSRVIDGKYGQVEIPRQNGAPAIVNCIMGEGHEPLVRGNEVLVYDRDIDRKMFIARSASMANPNSQSETKTTNTQLNTQTQLNNHE
ncbi:DUF1449 family protein [Verrucomicrobiaceae bacterium R5-34]|nr:DUF1449 family protein [Verrucomicrobiaceae bacterium R5-34]